MKQQCVDPRLGRLVMAYGFAAVFAVPLARATPPEPVAPAVQGTHADPQDRYERERAACLILTRVQRYRCNPFKSGH